MNNFAQTCKCKLCFKRTDLQIFTVFLCDNEATAAEICEGVKTFPQRFVAGVFSDLIKVAPAPR